MCNDDVTYFTIHGISDETFSKLLVSITTDIANIIFNENYTIDNIYDHVEFINGDITLIAKENLRKKLNRY